jgi:hypothetical protein
VAETRAHARDRPGRLTGRDPRACLSNGSFSDRLKEFLNKSISPRSRTSTFAESTVQKKKKTFAESIARI